MMDKARIARQARWIASAERRRIGRSLLSRADRARDERMFRDAGLLFEEAARLWPNAERFHVQAGHMFKEAGDYARAEALYATATAALPGDADLALQLGHFYKVAGQPASALSHYRRAHSLRPGWNEAVDEIGYMESLGANLLTGGDALAAIDDDDAVVRELLPSTAADVGLPPLTGIEFRRLGGRRESSSWGALPLMSGVEAVRGVCFSPVPLRSIELLLDDVVLHIESGPAPIRDAAGQSKYVFNIWFDLGATPPGPHRLEVRTRDVGDAVLRRVEAVRVVPPPSVDRVSSDGIVTVDPADSRDVETQVRALPSVAHPATRNALGQGVAAILVLRTDQLGDMVVSIPALRRLRALFPDAKIVGLVTAANADLARTTGLFNETVVIDFPVDPIDQRRVLTRSEQAALRTRLAPYRFDLCVDLGVGRLSRPLMRLSGAGFLAGVNDREWPWLDVGVDGDMHDPKNHSEAAPHSAKLLALVERIASLVDSGARILPRADLSNRRLDAFGVRRGGYIVLHCGAGQTFTRWPYFPELADQLLRASPHRLVIMGGAEVAGDPAFQSLAADPRVTLLTRTLSFDDFDAILSFAALFIGNDSGPKHLAALRGVSVISLHNARTNWGEWGQEQTGIILSRGVPCAGCSVSGDGHECGKAFVCLTDIRVDEVMDAAISLLAASRAPTEALDLL